MPLIGSNILTPGRDLPTKKIDKVRAITTTVTTVHEARIPVPGSSLSYSRLPYKP